MSTFNLSSVTIPTPEPYDDKDPQKQLENLSYVLLQIIDQAKQAGCVFVDSGDIDKALKDLKYNGELLDLGPFKIHLTGNAVSLVQP